MMKKRLLLSLVAGLLMVSSVAFASSEYTISTVVTPIDSDSYVFTYYVTNNTQSQGLDGFLILAPDTAAITVLATPDSYNGYPGYWTYSTYQTGADTGYFNASIINGYIGLYWWGCDPASVYPSGTTAAFSFQADGVSAGSSISTAVTYIGAYTYAAYNYEVQGPVSAGNVSTPEPATMILLGFGLAGLAGIRRKTR